MWYFYCSTNPAIYLHPRQDMQHLQRVLMIEWIVDALRFHKTRKFSQFLNLVSSLPRIHVIIWRAFILALTTPRLLYQCDEEPPSWGPCNVKKHKLNIKILFQLSWDTKSRLYTQWMNLPKCFVLNKCVSGNIPIFTKKKNIKDVHELGFVLFSDEFAWEFQPEVRRRYDWYRQTPRWISIDMCMLGNGYLQCMKTNGMKIIPISAYVSSIK